MSRLAAVAITLAALLTACMPGSTITPQQIQIAVRETCGWEPLLQSLATIAFPEAAPLGIIAQQICAKVNAASIAAGGPPSVAVGGVPAPAPRVDVRSVTLDNGVVVQGSFVRR